MRGIRVADSRVPIGVPVRRQSGVLTRVYYPQLCTYIICVYVRNVRVEENELAAIGGKKGIEREKRVGERRRPWIHYTRLRSRRRVFHTARHETTAHRRPRPTEERDEAYLNTERIITNSYSIDAPFGAYSLLIRSTSSTSRLLLWRTTKFSSTKFTSSARLSASE